MTKNNSKGRTETYVGGRLVSPDDGWTWLEPRPDDEVAKERADTLAHLRKIGLLATVEKIEARGFTCDGCARAPVCVLSFDPYNVDGDCIWDK